MFCGLKMFSANKYTVRQNIVCSTFENFFIVIGKHRIWQTLRISIFSCVFMAWFVSPKRYLELCINSALFCNFSWSLRQRKS